MIFVRHGLVVSINVLFYMPISPGLVVRLNFKILCRDYQSQFCMTLVKHELVVPIVLLYMPISPGLVVRLNFKILCMDYQSQFCMILVRHRPVVSVVLFFMFIWTGGPSDISSTVF